MESITSFVEYIKYWGQMIIEMLARIIKWKDKPENEIPTKPTEANSEEASSN